MDMNPHMTVEDLIVYLVRNSLLHDYVYLKDGNGDLIPLTRAHFGQQYDENQKADILFIDSMTYSEVDEEF